MSEKYVGPALFAYRQFKESPCDEYAMDALLLIAELGRPIPDDLLPYIPKACAAWQQAKGNRQRVRTAGNADALHAAIAWMAFWNKYKNMTIAEAASETNKIWPRFSVDHLIDKYTRADAQPHRERGSDAWYLLDTMHAAIARLK